MFLAKTGVTYTGMLGALVCGLSIFNASAAAADWDAAPFAASGDASSPAGAAGRGSFYGPLAAFGVAPTARSLCTECTPPGSEAVRVQPPELVQLAGLRGGAPVLLMPQASRPNAVTAPPPPPRLATGASAGWAFWLWG